jgi:hypothetical protein
MSRSYRKTPVCGITTARSEKQDKAIAHGRIRAALKSAESEFEFSGIRKLKQDPWSMGKDGKQTFDPAKHPDLMRK